MIIKKGRKRKEGGEEKSGEEWREERGGLRRGRRKGGRRTTPGISTPLAAPSLDICRRVLPRDK